MSNLFIVATKHTNHPNIHTMSYSQRNEFTHPTIGYPSLSLSLVLLFIPFLALAHSNTHHICRPAYSWHMWKFLRVHILFKSSATSKNKLYFNMHCVHRAFLPVWNKWFKIRKRRKENMSKGECKSRIKFMDVENSLFYHRFMLFFSVCVCAVILILPKDDPTTNIY